MTNTELNKFLEKALVNYGLTGLAVNIGIGKDSSNKNSGLKYIKAIGYKNFITKELLQPENIFHMASVTKLFVGASIMLLWEEEMIDLQGYLIDYLPWFKMADKRYKNITIRQLLSHTSGLPDVSNYHWDKPETDEGALERYVRSKEVAEAHLLWEPEEGRFLYSNIGYEILGLVIATLTNMPFEEYVKKNIFEPLSMKDSTLLTFERGIYEDDISKYVNLCTPHEKNSKKEIVKSSHFPYNRAHGPSSTLTSNIYDIEKWALAHMNRKLLKEQTYDIVWQEQALVPNNGEHVCLSWFKREQKGFTLYGHEGTDDGFRASFWICPELELYIVVCSNISNAPVKKISKQIFDLLTD